MVKRAEPKMTPPKLILHPEWGYACLCQICGERFQNNRDMATSERLYARHWRAKHRSQSA